MRMLSEATGERRTVGLQGPSPSAGGTGPPYLGHWRGQRQSSGMVLSEWSSGWRRKGLPGMRTEQTRW